MFVILLGPNIEHFQILTILFVFLSILLSLSLSQNKGKILGIPWVYSCSLILLSGVFLGFGVFLCMLAIVLSFPVVSMDYGV